MPLGEVCTITKKQGGTRPLPYVGLEDIASGGAGSFLGSLDPQTDKSTTFEFEPGHVLYGRLRPYLNKVLLPDFVGHCSSEIFPLLPLPQLDRGFLFHWLTSQRTVDAINATCTGARMPRANVSELMTFPIPLPPQDEQKRIVAVLDAALEGLSRARANAQANLADAQELFAAAHKGALARHSGAKRKVTMADVADIASTLVDPKLPEFSSLPHVGAGNMPTCSDQLLGVQTAAEEGLTSGKFLFDRRMVLYSKIRPYLRKASRPDFDGLCSADVYPLLPRAGVIERDYLFYVLLGPEFTDYAIIGSARAGMPKVNREHLFTYTFELPDLGRQREIADLLDEALAQARTLEDAFSSKLDAIERLRQSILQRAFSGELTSAKPVASTGNADLDAVLDELFLADAANVAPKSDPDAARRVKRIREILSDEWNGE